MRDKQARQERIAREANRKSFERGSFCILIAENRWDKEVGEGMGMCGEITLEIGAREPEIEDEGRLECVELNLGVVGVDRCRNK